MAAAAADERASLPKEYTYHSPGSVQETDDEVVFAHQTPEEASKWENATVHHVGDGSDAPVRVGVVIGEFHNRLMDRMLEDARVAAVSMVREKRKKSRAGGGKKGGSPIIGRGGGTGMLKKNKKFCVI